VSLAYNGAVGSWQHVTGLQPKNLNAWFQLAQAAQTAGQTTVAVSAYKQYLKLNPSSTSAPQIRAIIKQLSPAPPKKKK
jgi:predicted TPR repeat methyltransferase